MAKSIYDMVDSGSPEWLSNHDLKRKILDGLTGFSTGNIPVKTRSKMFKEKICDILEYPIPRSFKRTKPRFPMYNFDLYVQKENNLQVWNQVIDPSRRYVIIKVDEEGNTLSVKVIDGNELLHYDKTGTLTTKLQARLDIVNIETKIINKEDTKNLKKLIKSNSLNSDAYPYNEPKKNELLPIDEIYKKLSLITGGSYNFIDPKSDRQRGDIVHNICSRLLGYKNIGDNGQFPDIKNQLLEIKLQTSPTIDIGLEDPISDDINKKISSQYDIRNEDVRYAVVYAVIESNMVNIKNLIVVNGANFYTIFPQMQGNIVNGKIQLPLPTNFFD